MDNVWLQSPVPRQLSTETYAGLGSPTHAKGLQHFASTAMDEAMERAHLAEADRHIAEAQQRIARQESLIEELGRDGHDTARSRDLLRLLQETLKLMVPHR